MRSFILMAMLLMGGVLRAGNDLNITGIRVSAACELNATQQAFTYNQWAGPVRSPIAPKH